MFRICSRGDVCPENTGHGCFIKTYDVTLIRSNWHCVLILRHLRNSFQTNPDDQLRTRIKGNVHVFKAVAAWWRTPPPCVRSGKQRRSETSAFSLRISGHADTLPDVPREFYPRCAARLGSFSPRRARYEATVGGHGWDTATGGEQQQQQQRRVTPPFFSTRLLCLFLNSFFFEWSGFDPRSNFPLHDADTQRDNNRLRNSLQQSGCKVKESMWDFFPLFFFFCIP